MVADLARMPHLLVAGATGTGKSVSMNAMIMSILFKATPRDVRFIMIDPKMLELSTYEDIPHLLVPVVTDPKKAAAALSNVIREMDERYRLLHEKGVRNIDSYNRLIANELPAVRGGAGGARTSRRRARRTAAAASTRSALVHRHLPRIVIIIDELADLMMTVGREIEESITRLAQKARAAGIHLILATQRPSVDVITGLIKANFPARISFQVTSRIDSRTILDAIGAERLLGEGDMLFLPPGTARVQRLHGAFVSDADVHRVVDFVKRQEQPRYEMELLESPEEDEDGEGGDEEDLSDEMYDMAVRLVTEHRQASISWLQRRLRVGYNRAARMIERMEREGVVAPGGGRSAARGDRAPDRGVTRPDRPAGQGAARAGHGGRPCHAVTRRRRASCGARPRSAAAHAGAGGAPRAWPRHVKRAPGALRRRRARCTADFRQTVESPTLAGTLESHGTVAFEKPNRMRWDYEPPGHADHRRRRRDALDLPARPEAGDQGAARRGLPVEHAGHLPRRARPRRARLRRRRLERDEPERWVLTPRADRRTRASARSTLGRAQGATPASRRRASPTPLGTTTRILFSRREAQRDARRPSSSASPRPPGVDVVQPPAY